MGKDNDKKCAYINSRICKGRHSAFRIDSTYSIERSVLSTEELEGKGVKLRNNKISHLCRIKHIGPVTRVVAYAAAGECRSIQARDLPILLAPPPSGSPAGSDSGPHWELRLNVSRDGASNANLTETRNSCLFPPSFLLSQTDGLIEITTSTKPLLVRYQC